MPDSIERYIRDLQMKQNLWLGGPCANYAIAYTVGYDTYKETLASQAQADKERAELFVLAASIASSTVLIAAFGSASLRVLAGRAALHTVCSNNLTRTFEFMHLASNNKATMFALGALLDGVKASLSREVDEAAQILTRSASTIVASSPLIQKTQIEQFVYLNMACAQRVAAAVQDSTTLSGAERDQIVAKLRAAPIFNPPTRQINTNALSKRIELSFYMSSILDSDFLVNWPAQYIGDNGIGAAMNATERPIGQSPRAGNYPRPASPSMEIWGRPAHQSIRIGELGGKVRERIDTLHREIFRTPFYRQRGFLDNGKPTNHGELIKAERTLDNLAERTRPLRIDDARV